VEDLRTNFLKKGGEGGRGEKKTKKIAWGGKVRGGMWGKRRRRPQ